MKMKENELRLIVTEVLKVLEREKQLSVLPDRKKEKKGAITAYVLCEQGRDREVLDFLRKNRKNGNVKAVAVLEDPNPQLVRTMLEEKLCLRMTGIHAGEEDAIRVSIYPTIHHNSVCEAGLGMYRGYASRWFHRDIAAGRKMIFLSDGIEDFTGREPNGYCQQILHYLANMMRMGAVFIENQEMLPGTVERLLREEASEAAGRIGNQMAAACFAENTNSAMAMLSEKNRITKDIEPMQESAERIPGKAENTGKFRFAGEGVLTLDEIRQIPSHSVLSLKGKRIMTPLAKDRIRDRNLRIVYEQ